MKKPSLKTNTKSIQCSIGGLELKSIEDSMKIGGFISTTHLDEGFINNTRSDGSLTVPELPEGVHIRDVVSLDLMKEWDSELNKGVPRANKVSIQHDRSDPIVAGVVEKGSSNIMQLPDGNYGLYVEDILDPTHDSYDTTKTRLDVGTYDGFSIEFGNAKYELNEREGYYERTLLPGTVLKGHAIVPRPMNEYAIRLKEIDSQLEKLDINLNFKKQVEIKDSKEENKMTDEIIAEVKTDDSVKLSNEEMKEYLALKEAESKRSEVEKMASLKAEILKEVAEQKETVEIKTKPSPVNDDEIKAKHIPELAQFKEAVDCKKQMVGSQWIYEKSVRNQFKSAGELADKMGLTVKGIRATRPVDQRVGEFKFTTNGTLLEAKGLGITTNQGSTYYISAPELQDVFDPVIYNTLNQATTTWSLLEKDDFSAKGNNKVQFKVKTAINNSLDTSTNGFYTGNAVVTGNGTRMPAETKFKKQAVGVEVDGDMIAAAKGGPVGDVFALEVMSATEDLMSYANKALFAEKGAETDAEIIGFEYITDSAGNTTLYSYTRSDYTTFLAPASAASTYINQASGSISLSNLRAAIRQAKTQGANVNDLFFSTSLVQEDMFKGIYDAIQRTVPTSSRFGFEGMLSIDGVPIFGDKDCNSDDWFLIDKKTHRIAIWVPPTLEMLGKDSDAEKGFIKMYWATYNLHPIRMVQIYGCATS